MTQVSAHDAHSLLGAAGYGTFLLDLGSGQLRWSKGAASLPGMPGTGLPQDRQGLQGFGYGKDSLPLRSFLDRAENRQLPERAGSVFFLQNQANGPECSFELRLIALGQQANEASAARVIGSMRNVTTRRAPSARVDLIDDTSTRIREDRNRLYETLAAAIARQQMEGQLVSYLVIGLDNLDQLNEAYGYNAADEAIETIGSRIVDCLRRDDAIGRLGGSMYGAILKHESADDLSKIAHRIQASIRRDVIETASGPFAGTVSIGVVTLRDAQMPVQEILEAGEDALSAARARGADSVSFHNEDTEQKARRRRNIAVAADIVAAIEENRLCLAYQPVVVSDGSRRVSFHECLVRMIDRDGSILAAGHFMPVAESLGLVRMIDRKVLALAFETLERAPHARLSVNVSPLSANDYRWREIFIQHAAERRDLTERLILEITETAAIEDRIEITSFIDEMHAYGCAIAIDDFGAGYTSFRNIRDLRVDMVKIDGSFVRNILESSDNQIFVRALQAIAKNFDMMTVAEFVETAEEASFLHAMGIDCLQGYHLGKPTIDPAWLN
ncbi:MAG: bifunctional diguanylate cyclase/phosphodiesterase [Neomegalonema sp.]|nr:bifunctional diguanylate cyclase/phosphodiesterase [Neomegalonema sp.]